jgi:hypothetical protein
MKEDTMALESVHGGLLEALKHGWEFFTSPGVYFDRLALRTHWLTPVVVVAAGTILLAWLMAPYSDRAMRYWLVEMAGPEAAQRPEAFQETGIWGGLAAPLPLLGISLAQAALLMVIANVFTGRGSFRKMFSLVAHVSVFSLAASVFVYVVLFLRGLENIQSWADFKVPIGLNMIWAELGPGMDALLNALNVFQAFTIGYLMIGVRRMCQCSRGHAALVTLTFSLLDLGCRISMAVLFSAMRMGPKG